MSEDIVMTQEEVGEYISKLQSGKAELQSDDFLEQEAFNNMKQLSGQIAQMTNQKNQADKDLERAKAQIAALESQINATSGQLTGYAQLLVAAENRRRANAQQDELDAERDNTAEDDEARRAEARAVQAAKKKANAKQPAAKPQPQAAS